MGAAVSEPQRAELVRDRLRGRRLPTWLLLVPALALLAAFFAYPVAKIAVESVTDGGLGLGHYRELLHDGVTVHVVVRTLLVALAVSVLTLLLAYPYAYLMTIVAPRTRVVLMFVVLLPFWTSLMARGFAWVLLLQDGGPVERLTGLSLMGTVWAVIIAMAQVLLAFMVLPLYSSLQAIDRRYLDAAASLGAPRHSAFLRAYLPLSLPGVVAGFSLVFILSMGFFVIPALLGSSQDSVVAQLIQERTSALLDFPGAGALGTTLLVVTLALLALVQLAGRRAVAAPDQGGDAR
jgi:putative spermidine/putrescine transport system permease protein